MKYFFARNVLCRPEIWKKKTPNKREALQSEVKCVSLEVQFSLQTKWWQPSPLSSHTAELQLAYHRSPETRSAQGQKHGANCDSGPYNIRKPRISVRESERERESERQRERSRESERERERGVLHLHNAFLQPRSLETPCYSQLRRFTTTKAAVQHNPRRCLVPGPGLGVTWSHSDMAVASSSFRTPVMWNVLHRIITANYSNSHGPEHQTNYMLKRSDNSVMLGWIWKTLGSGHRLSLGGAMMTLNGSFITMPPSLQVFS